MSFAVGMTILLVTAFVQAAVQLVVFMHAGETEDKEAIYTNIYYDCHSPSYHFRYITNFGLGYVGGQGAFLTLPFQLHLFFLTFIYYFLLNIIHFLISLEKFQFLYECFLPSPR